jgi:hypothetical protein
MSNWGRRTNVCALAVVLTGTGFSAGDPHAVPSIGYHLPRSFPVGAAARLVTHADLNGDGKEDLIFAGQTCNSESELWRFSKETVMELFARVQR